MLMMPTFKSWFLVNLDEFETIQGQFFALDLKQKVGAEYREHWALNRQHAILQWVHGKTPTTTFRAFYYAKHTGDDITATVDRIKSWTQRLELKGRPPVLLFWVGDGHVTETTCVLEDVDVTIHEPTAEGEMRHAELVLSLRAYKEFDIGLVGNTDTRYHHARERDYYEMLCVNEYGDPSLGDIIRKRHPDKANLVVGDVVKLPAIEGVRKSVVKTTSIPLAGAYDRKDNPARTLRIDMFNRRNRSYTSHVGQAE